MSSSTNLECTNCFAFFFQSFIKISSNLLLDGTHSNKLAVQRRVVIVTYTVFKLHFWVIFCGCVTFLNHYMCCCAL